MKFIYILTLQCVASAEIMKSIVPEERRKAVFSNAFIVFITLRGNKENK